MTITQKKRRRKRRRRKKPGSGGDENGKDMEKWSPYTSNETVS